MTVIFHLLTVFPSNAAEQARYYITNMCKKHQCISVHQIMQHVEQLNSYIAQLPCWFYNPSGKPSTIPMNVPFTKDDLATWLGNPLRIPRNSAIILIPDLLNSGIFIGIIFF